MFGHPLADLCEIDTETGEIKPVVTIVTDNGGPFRSFRFEVFILAKHAEEYRIEYNETRPHEALAWNRPKEVHRGLASPTVPTFQTTENLPTP